MIKNETVQYCIGVDIIGQKVYISHDTSTQLIDSGIGFKLSKPIKQRVMSNKPKGTREKRF